MKPAAALAMALALVPACFDAGGRSIAVAGRLQFSNLTPAPGHGSSLQAEMAGALVSVRADEVEAWARAGSTVAAAGAIIGLALLAKFAGLALRANVRDPLRNTKRARLVAYIRDNPGATFRELVRETGIASGTLRHHVGVLRQHGLVDEYRHLETLRYFDHGTHSETWRGVVYLREPELARLHQWLDNAGPSFQKEVVAASAGWGWSRSTTQHRLKRLVAGGLVSVTEQGRLRRYAACGEAVQTRSVAAGAGAVQGTQVAS